MNKIRIQDYNDSKNGFDINLYNIFSIIKKPKDMSNDEAFLVAEYVYNKLCGLYNDSEEVFIRVTQQLFTYFGFIPLDKEDFKYNYNFNNGDFCITDCREKPEILRINGNKLQLDYLIVPEDISKCSLNKLLDVVREQFQDNELPHISEISTILKKEGLQSIDSLITPIYVRDALATGVNSPRKQQIIDIYQDKKYADENMLPLALEHLDEKKPEISSEKSGKLSQKILKIITRS